MRRSLPVLLLLAVACSGSSSGPADVPSADVPADVPADVADPGLDPGPADIAPDTPADTDVPPPAGARARVLAAGDAPIGGPTSVATTGDVVLENGLVRFALRNQARSLSSPYPGALVDADLVRPAGEPGQDQFVEVFPMVGFARVFRPTKMEVVDDGAASGTAIVRFTGGEGGMSMIDSVLQTAAMGLEATTDYVLAPGARHLEIVTRVRNAGDWTGPVDLGQVLQFGKRLFQFHDQCGTNGACLSTTEARWLAGATGGVSYALTVPAPGGISMLLSFDAMMVLETGSFAPAKGEEVTVRQYLAVGDGTVEDAVSIVKAIRGEPAGLPVSLEVTLADAHPAMDQVLVQVRRADAAEGRGWTTATRPGADGRATVRLEAGTYDFVLSLPGAPDVTVAGVAVAEGKENRVALAASPAGFLHVRARDAQGKALTAALVLQSGTGAGGNDGIVRYEAIHDGELTIPVLPGPYTATVAHGLVWSIDRRDVTVAAGQVAEVEATLSQVVDTTGYRMLNTHEHTEWSPDSTVAVEDRVWNALANGIDLMNPTDHDHFGSRQAIIDGLGLSDRVHSFTGCEVSPLWGHSTAAGCRNPPAYETYYAVDFVKYDATGTMERLMTAAEIHRQARDQFQCDFLAVNHPYRSEGTFVKYGIDAVTDPAHAEPGLDLHLVDAMEVYNKSDDPESMLALNLPAWFNLLDRGYRVAAIGGSDEHGYAGSYGTPRNMVPSTLPLGDPGLQAEVFGAMKAYRHLMLGGPVIRLEAGGKGLGETVAAPSGTVPVRLRVQAPDWMRLSFAKVWANGVLVKDLVPADAGVDRVDETFDLAVPADAWIVAAAGSLQEADRMGPVSPRMPFSVTNPVFVDVDGGGFKARLAPAP